MPYVEAYNDNIQSRYSEVACTRVRIHAHTPHQHSHTTRQRSIHTQ